MPVKPVRDFQYGWCTTDHKDGKEIREFWRADDADYLNDEPYATRVHAMLGQLGLPVPEKDQIFRGTHHDLLFLDSHGVVIRIGPTDVEDLMNPGILQPLGWLEDKEHLVKLDTVKVPLTVAIYPGIELYNNYVNLPEHKRPPLVGDLRELFRATQQEADDLCDDNCGIIRVLDDNGAEVAVKILLDADNSFNPSSKESAEMRSRTLKQQERSSHTKNKGEILFNTLRSAFNVMKDIHLWERAFETHQPLRHLFGEAFQGVKAVSGIANDEKRATFWSKCAEVTNKPEFVTMPVWKSETTQDGSLNFKREEITVPNLVLYRPWTGQKSDALIKPISKSLAESVARAHHKKFGERLAKHMAKLKRVFTLDSDF